MTRTMSVAVCACVCAHVRVCFVCLELYFLWESVCNVRRVILSSCANYKALFTKARVLHSCTRRGKEQ